MTAFEDAIIDARLAPAAFGRRHDPRRRVAAGCLPGQRIGRFRRLIKNFRVLEWQHADAALR
jgi:hypothetical protein